MVGSLGFPKSQNRWSAWEPIPCRDFKIQVLFHCHRNIGHRTPSVLLRVHDVEHVLHSLSRLPLRVLCAALDSSRRSGDHGIVQSLNREEHGSRRMNMAITESEQHGNQKLSFRCSDVGPKNCDWQITANSEAEIMPKIEQHGREKHNLKIDDETRRKVHNAIQRRAA